MSPPLGGTLEHVTPPEHRPFPLDPSTEIIRHLDQHDLDHPVPVIPARFLGQGHLTLEDFHDATPTEIAAVVDGTLPPQVTVGRSDASPRARGGKIR